MGEVGGSEFRLLLIDDDHHVEALAVALAHFNIAVDARTSWDEQVLATTGMREPHVLLTGVLMADSHGVDLAAAVRVAWPDIGVVFMAGAVEAPLFERLPPDGVVVRRPFTTRELLDALRTAAPAISLDL
ncbi:MAG: FixJ family two-component response regulator [Candidatus Poriferisodalaceae bacterium]|jgi:FixJ family two-component response regulator